MLSRALNSLRSNNSNSYLLKNVLQNNKLGVIQNAKKLYNSEAIVTVKSSPETVSVKKQKTSKAMLSYLERAREHDEFMKTQHIEYQIGKRHLANMMGEDPETFTQEDIDNAVSYLFPSGIYDPIARPLIKKPEEVFPARKAAEFDETGRPFHSMFYTGKPNFFKLLHDIVEEINTLSNFEERMLRRGVSADPNQKIDLKGFTWIAKEELELLLVEKIAILEYSNFTNAMDRLVSLPFSYKSKDFIKKYTKSLMANIKQFEIPKPKIDEKGRQYITTYECLRKTARGDVTVFLPGTGKITINDKDITYFDNVQSREQLLFPLIYSEMLGKVDIEAHVSGGGTSAQAGALRWGIAMSLRSFVNAEMVEQMRLAGLLQRDYRRRERKKYGQEGARRKYTWKKR